MDHKRRKLIREIDHYCKTSGILIVTKHGMMLMLTVPFRVMVITELTPFEVGDVLRVGAVKMDEALVLLYMIENRSYYYNHFIILVGDDEY
jgi:hypothetical protein